VRDWSYVSEGSANVVFSFLHDVELSASAAATSSIMTAPHLSGKVIRIVKNMFSVGAISGLPQNQTERESARLKACMHHLWLFVLLLCFVFSLRSTL
jgi:hypothetical protein